MAPISFTDLEIQQHTGVLSFLYRQLLERPSLPHKDLTGKTIVVTGSNTGIGFECASQLLDLGVSNLILAVRSEAKGEAARTQLLSDRSVPNSTVEVWQLDLESYESIFAFVERTRSLKRLDIVILNAGVAKQFYSTTPSTGHEEVIQVNVISTALLTILLLPVLKAKASSDGPSRLAIVSSDTTYWAKFRERNSVPLLPALDKEENFNQFDRYPTSKLLTQLFMTELAKRIPSSVAVITLPNPGWCYDTALGHVPGGTMRERISYLPRRTIGRSPSIGARVVTDGAIEHGQESHGEFIQDCQIQPKAPLVYSPEGERLTKILWDEIMAELSFAGVGDILHELVD
ncbi:NAD(P)-binding protein [Annulohypoxylon nitens]|nr:NAD(P)-binding protein [Annulohypoxylon nitens]